MSFFDSECCALVGQAYDLYESFNRINAPNAFKEQWKILILPRKRYPSPNAGLSFGVKTSSNINTL